MYVYIFAPSNRYKRLTVTAKIMNAITIKNILQSEKSRTAQAQQIFAEYANKLNITEFSKAECAMLRAWFKAVVPEIDAFYSTKAGNDALCHGLKNLQKGAAANSSTTTGHEETDNNNYKGGNGNTEQKPEQEHEQKAEQKAEEAQQQVTRSPEELTATERECYELIQADLIPYLYGPAGTGKTTAAEHIAEALGLKFYFTPSVFEKFDLTGFVDGNGTLIDTPFIQAFLNGGLFLFDEWDVSDPQAIKFFNMALSQRMFVIPKYGIVRAHRDFKIMAAGNTRGTGATSNYPTALTQDASCRNRFIPIYYDYNCEIENMLAEDDGELIEFVHDLRNAIKESGLDTVISYRNIINCKRMQKMPYYSTNEALIIKRCFAGDFDADNLDMVVSNMTTTRFNKYTALFNGLNIQ